MNERILMVRKREMVREMTEVQIVGTAMSDNLWVLHCNVCGPLGVSDISAATEASAHLHHHTAVKN